MNILKVTTFLLTLFFAASAAAQDAKTILFFGDSITAGYGIDEEDAFPAQIQRKIDEKGLSYRVVNAGLSGETSAGGLRRVDWILQQHIDLFVLGLGGNDGLRGINPESTKENLAGIMDKVAEKYPDAIIILTGMEAPPNMGSDYTERFRQIYTELYEKYEVVFMPFILEGVAGDPDLNLADGIHPTEEGHEILAENLWNYLLPVL
ncbi:MAG: arylesterase [Balneolaceae bacterium]|nr:MAG: arylesterase [Balneolaceae bacterium]